MISAFKKAVYVAAVLAAGGYAFVQLSGDQGLPALMEKRRQIRALEDRNSELRQENERRRKWVGELQNPAIQKRLVREKLHYVEDDEIDFKTPVDKPAAK